MPDTVRQAGAVAIRGTGSAPEVLVVRSSDGRHRIFPKGHIEPGEEPGAAALRELREEAGVDGGLVGPVDRLAFEAGGTRFQVDYFLVLAGDRRAGAPGEPAGETGRDPRWLTLDGAADALSFDDARALLHRLEPAIRTTLSSGDPP